MDKLPDNIYKEILEHAVDGIIIGSPTGEIIEVNTSILKILGCNKEEVIGKHISEIFPQHVLDKTPLRFDLLDKGEALITEREIIRKDNTTVFVEMHSKKMPNGGYHSFVRDITSRKNTEKSLYEFKNALEASTDAIGISTPDGVHYYQNKAFDELFGLTPEEIANPHPKSTIYADEKIGGFVFDTIMHGGEWIGEIKMIAKNKKIIDVYLRAYAIKDDLGKVVGLVGVHTDITERKQIESELDNHTRLLTTLLENLPIGVFMVEAPSGKPLIANEAAKEFLGRGILPDVQKENIGEIYKAFKNSTNKPYPAEEMPIIKGLYGQEAHVNDMIIERPDGKKVLLEVSGCPVYDKSGKITASLVTFTDITEKQKLLESAQRADKLESLGILAGGIAHDFNNLLGGIYGLMNMALSAKNITTIKEYINASLSTMNRARSLTQQLLTFAKGGAPQRKNEELFPFVEETANFALSGSNIGINFIYPENLWSCIIDKSQISQVIENIVINAQQAMPAGGKIEVVAKNLSLRQNEHATLKAGNYVEISIKDSGIGIPKEIISRVFDPFFTTKIKGHGLGLATCYSIINRHGGFIDVESEAGQGSTFKIFLPASLGENALASDQRPSMHAGKGTFVLMDDQKVIRDTVGAMLRSFGYSVVLKNNGIEALDFVRKELADGSKIKAMIFDLTIPGSMGGKEAISELKKLYPNIPVFVASGYTDDPVMANPKKYGFTASISKPFTTAELATMLNSHLVS
jgi:PAS domain S-box-containing protein